MAINGRVLENVMSYKDCELFISYNIIHCDGNDINFKRIRQPYNNNVDGNVL